MDNNPIYTAENETNEPEYVRTEEYYRTIVNGISFQLYFQQLGNMKYYTIIDSKGNDCVRINIDGRDPEKELLMGGLSYRPSCALDSTLTRGDRTISMIKAALIFAMKMEPELQYVVFSDDSHFDCRIPGELTHIKIPLHTHNFLLYGQTWYQRMFGAVPADNGFRVEQMEPSIMSLHEPLSDTDSLWNIKTTNISNVVDGWVFDAKKEMQTMFASMSASGATCVEYLRAIFSKESPLAKKYGENIPCSVFYLLMPKLVDYFNVPQFQMTQWKIERSVITSYPEYNSTIAKNDSPSHTKRRNTYKNKSRLSYLFNNMPYYTVGGSKRKFYMSRKYGGLRGYLSYPKHERVGKKFTVKTPRALRKRIDAI
jgi:hypothetical protein